VNIASPLIAAPFAAVPVAVTSLPRTTSTAGRRGTKPVRVTVKESKKKEPQWFWVEMKV